MTGTNSSARFDATWLHLREAADHRSRCAELATAAAAWLREYGGAQPLAVDLGAGAGANLRYLLRAGLDGTVLWRLVDQDGALLEQARAGLGLGDRLDVRVTDLADDLHAAVSGARLVSASALLDLTSATWIAALAEACRAARAAVLVALTIDGRVRFDPCDPDDAFIAASVAADERRDKGFGTAMGSRAAGCLESALASRGYRLRSADSSWRLGPDDERLASAWLEGWRQAARRARPDARERMDAWAARRQQALRDEALRIVVGHTDVLGLPDRPFSAHPSRRRSRS